MQASPSKPPLPRLMFWGYHAFSMGLRWDPVIHGRAEVRLSVGSRGRGSAQGEFHAGRGHALHAPDALRWLAAHWRRMVIAFAEPRDAAEGAQDGVFDLAAGLGLAAEGPVIWTVCGGEVEVRSGQRSHAFGHGAIPPSRSCPASPAPWRRGCACGRARAEAVAAWEAAFAAADVLPWAAEDLSAEEKPSKAEWLAEEMRKAHFYCRCLGVDLDRYIRASVWLLAKQGHFALGRRSAGEPDWHGLGWDAPGFAALPTLAGLEASTPQQVRDLYAFGAKAGEPLSWGGFVAAALMQRTGDLRAALYWPRPAEAA